MGFLVKGHRTERTIFSMCSLEGNQTKKLCSHMTSSWPWWPFWTPQRSPVKFSPSGCFIEMINSGDDAFVVQYSTFNGTSISNPTGNRRWMILHLDGFCTIRSETSTVLYFQNVLVIHPSHWNNQQSRWFKQNQHCSNMSWMSRMSHNIIIVVGLFPFHQPLVMIAQNGTNFGTFDLFCFIN